MSNDSPVDKSQSLNDEVEGVIDLDNITIGGANKDSSCCDLNIFKKFTRRSIMSFCAKSIAFLTPICAYSIYLVLPYYVLSTPEKGWDAADLALFYAAASVGETVGSQVVPLAAVLDSNNALFIGHMAQMLLPFLGYFCMSSLLFFNKWLFAMGMFSCGFSNGLSVVQAYCTEIADGDESFEVELMSQLGQLNILSNLVSAFVLPAIYDSAGFEAYCLTMMGVVFGMMCTLSVLIICLRAQEAEYKPSYHTFSPEGGDNDGSDAVHVEDQSSKDVDESANAMSNHVHLETTAIPITKYLSPSMYMLLMLKVAQSFSAQIYCISYPVVFAQDFGVSPSVGGFLYGGAALLGVFGVAVNASIGNRVGFWEYPYDIALYFALAGLSYLSYVMFFAEWIAYSFHVLAMGSSFALFGIEMTCRLYLCPSQAFQQITGIVGVLQALTYLSGSVLAPQFLTVSIRFPFLVLAILSFSVTVAALCIFAYRSRVLKQNFAGLKVKGNTGYLAKERAYYAMVHQSSSRRGAILSDEARVGLMDDIQGQLDELRHQFASRRGFTFLLNPMAACRMEQFANNAAVAVEFRKSQFIANEKREQRPGYNPNALIQMDEMEEMDVSLKEEDEEDEDSDNGELAMYKRLDSIHEKIGMISYKNSSQSSVEENDKDQVMISSAVNAKDQKKKFRDPKLSFIGSAGPAAKYTPTKKNAMTVRNSIYNVALEVSPKKKSAKRQVRMSMARRSMFRTCEPAIALGGNVGAMDSEHEAVRRAKAIQNSRKSVFMTGMGR